MPELYEHLSKLREAFSKNDGRLLKELSAEFAGDAFIHFQRENVSLSIVAYSCAKFLDKPYVVSNSAWNSFRKKMLELLNSAIIDLNAGREDKALAKVRLSLDLIQKLSAKLGRFAKNVVEKAKLKVGAEVYAKGASLGMAAELSGADKFDLSSYISATKMPEKYYTKAVSERMLEAKRVFS